MAFYRALNFLFPPYCKICGKLFEDELCTNCYLRLKRYEDFNIVEFKNKNNFIPYKLRRGFEKRTLSKLIYFFKYKNNIRKMIIDFKFHNKFYLSKVFSKIMLKNEKLCGIFEFYDIIISVPMHKNKLIMRRV